MLGAVRGMMLYHTRNISEPQLRAAQARALVDFLVESPFRPRRGRRAASSTLTATFSRAD